MQLEIPVPVTAIALSGRVDLAQAAERLRWRELRRYVYGSVFETETTGRLYLYTFGALVHQGVERIDPAILKVLETATQRQFLPETEETYYLSVDPSREEGALSEGNVRVGWDRVVLPNDQPELVSAVSLLLGQSAALERYEQGADELIRLTLEISRKMEQRGRPPRATRNELRRIGSLTSYRLELASLFYILDRPEETWEHQEVATLYDALFRNLELGERNAATLHKLQAVENVADTVINIWQGRVSNRLEWAIVLLIVVDILLALFEFV